MNSFAVDGKTEIFNRCNMPLMVKAVDFNKLYQEYLVKDKLLKEMAEALDKAVRSVSELIGYSRGVDGLHLNGDVATWESLRTGGCNEGWLIEFDEAASFLQKYHEQDTTNAE